MASTDAMPVPKKNVAYRHYFAIRDVNGDLVTTWAGQDSELSADGGNFADATNEATEVQTSGTGYIDLTAGEMNYDHVTLKITVTNTDAKTYVCDLFPEDVGDIRCNANQLAGSTQSATDLKDFADTGYDPSTHKVQGVALVDTTTTNTDMVAAAPTANDVRDAILDDATRFSGANIDAAISSRGTADTGDAMTLADASIKAATYDGTGAFPLVAADTITRTDDTVNSVTRAQADEDVHVRARGPITGANKAAGTSPFKKGDGSAAWTQTTDADGNRSY